MVCDFDGRDLLRTRPGSMTKNCPAQSSRPSKMLTMTVPTSAGDGMGRRNRTMPQDAGRPALQASSPKSLSKVRRIRFSRTARSNTSPSRLPGASVRTQARLCPAARNSCYCTPWKSFVREKAHRQAAPVGVRGYTFSARNASLAYWGQAAISSWVTPG